MKTLTLLIAAATLAIVATESRAGGVQVGAVVATPAFRTPVRNFLFRPRAVQVNAFVAAPARVRSFRSAAVVTQPYYAQSYRANIRVAPVVAQHVYAQPIRVRPIVAQPVVYQQSLRVRAYVAPVQAYHAPIQYQTPLRYQAPIQVQPEVLPCPQVEQEVAPTCQGFGYGSCGAVSAFSAGTTINNHYYRRGLFGNRFVR